MNSKPLQTEQTQLSKPFTQDEFEWRVIELSEDKRQARVRPQLTIKALTHRLNQTLGSYGWSYEINLSEQALACTLTIFPKENFPAQNLSGQNLPAQNLSGASNRKISRSAVVSLKMSLAGVVSFEARGEDALIYAAEKFGLRPPLTQSIPYWVDFDAENKTILYEPEANYQPSNQQSSLQKNENENSSTTTNKDSLPLVDTADSNFNKSAGQQAIDKLIARLKEQGKGFNVATLIMKYKGYGEDEQAARDLYSELRNLLQTTLKE